MLRRTSLLLVGLALAAIGCGPPPPDEQSYLERLIADRAAKDEYLSGSDSFVPIDRRSWMVPLHYYEPDLSYRVPAQLVIGEDQPVFEIPTSTGQMRPYQRVGTLEFTLHGERMTLSALVEVGQSTGTLFVPFRDATSGAETYPAGRYLDLPNTRTGIYDLDFNRAYHPNCYFNEDYDCPFPPPENRLATAIRAGERMPPEDQRRIPMKPYESSSTSPSPQRSQAEVDTTAQE